MVPLLLAACGGDPAEEEAIRRARQSLAEAGPWHIPADTLAIGDTQSVSYTGAGPWIGEEGCHGGITSGATLLRDYLYTYFPQTYSIGGYSCRPINGNPSEMSVHATGRALDIMLPLDGGEADNGLGDPIGNWLIENAEAIGIQFIIWDLYTWGAHRAPGSKGQNYGGAHPHHDHLHVELSVEVAENQALWFVEAVDPPLLDGCLAVPPQGAVMEETDPCFRAFGPAEYWRFEAEGSGGSLLWTNAFQNDSPSNWARWNVVVEESGPYEIEVYVDPAWGVHRETRYRVTHPGGEDVIFVDQSAQHEWVSLGEYELAAGAAAWVDVFDDVPGEIEDDQRIVVDAVRLTGRGFEPPESPPTPEDPDTDPDDPSLAATVELSGEASCSMGTGPARGGPWALLLAVVGLVTRRRERSAAGV